MSLDESDTRILPNNKFATAEWHGSGGSSLTCKLWDPGSIEGQSTLNKRWIMSLWGRNVSEHFGVRLTIFFRIPPHSQRLEYVLRVLGVETQQGQ